MRLRASTADRAGSTRSGLAVASIDRRADGRYRARWREHPGGPQQSKHFARKADAERFLDGVRGDLARGQYVDPSAGRIAFREYAESWQASQVHRPTTALLVDSQLRNHILPFFGERPVASIRPSHVQSWVKSRSTVLSPAVIKVAYRFLSSIFRSAVRDRLISVSPCEQIRLPRVDRSRIVPLSTDAVLRVVALMPSRYRAAVVLSAGAGLRQGEVLGLQARHVDFLGRIVHVEQQMITAAGPPYIGPPKTPSSVRTLPISEAVIEELARHFEAENITSGQRDRMVFTTASGALIRRSSFAEVWRRAADAAHLPPGTGFHALRHFYASLLIRHGESVKVVQERLGHSTAAETLDTYSHLWPDSQDRTRQAVELVLGVGLRGREHDEHHMAIAEADRTAGGPAGPDA
jgi:integrase